ncbi:helix-turn-helix domain-containing protein [Aquimarina sp. AD1]|uniref:helix-turn-helix domain-containing protein n=1 Tax=Aquimarina sp. (strain AD1) TaxID=1714848 RepID=UPI000E490A9C|nr:AraC family transcriptional regulator [Aquimarina sp. AD1]AXT55096.1 helix-turn-helix domain-containing protein [Aquimarina sp. AD1]
MKDFSTFLTYSGISTIFFLMLLLTHTWKKREANKLLLNILLSFLFLFLTYASSYLNWNFLSTIVSPIGFIGPFVLGPLIFQYIKTIYTSNINRKSFIYSLLPFGIAFIFYSIPQYIFGLPIDEEITLLRIVSIVIPFLGILHLSYYLFLSNKLLKRFKKLVKNNYANLKKLDLKWLSIWIRGFIVFLIIDLVSGVLIVSYPIMPVFIYTNLFYLVLLIWYIGYFGIHQTQVFLVNEISQNPINDSANRSKSFFNCESEELLNLKTQLQIKFSEEKLFKEQDLSLKKTADILNVSDKKLSHLLNICMDSNFYEYVNTYRVSYFKEQLELGVAEKLTLLSIAFDSGFNSKATFNRVFKQQVGMTPIKFKKQLEKKSQSFH